MIKSRRTIAGPDNPTYNPNIDEYVEFAENFLAGDYDATKETRDFLKGCKHALFRFSKTSPEVFGESFDAKVNYINATILFFGKQQTSCWEAIGTSRQK